MFVFVVVLGVFLVALLLLCVGCACGWVMTVVLLELGCVCGCACAGLCLWLCSWLCWVVFVVVVVSVLCVLRVVWALAVGRVAHTL